MRLLLFLMPLLGSLPLFILRFMGKILGVLCYGLLKSRRRIALINLALCFPKLTKKEHKKLALRVFIHYAQSLFDRSWLWHAPVSVIKKRLSCIGVWEALDKAPTSTIIFLPHFFGLDAAATALMLHRPSPHYCTIFTGQTSEALTAWMAQGRSRFSPVAQFPRGHGIREIARALKNNSTLILLPDMNFDPKESVFVPFFSHTACTVPSLSRFAKLGGAKVVPLLARITPKGYEIEVKPAWENFPSIDLVADTMRMNQELEAYILTMPAQYFWVHRRFKDLPKGQMPPY